MPMSKLTFQDLVLPTYINEVIKRILTWLDMKINEKCDHSGGKDVNFGVKMG